MLTQKQQHFVLDTLLLLIKAGRVLDARTTALSYINSNDISDDDITVLENAISEYENQQLEISKKEEESTNNSNSNPVSDSTDEAKDISSNE